MALQSTRPRSSFSSEQEAPAIDLVHLSRQTLGDRDLEVELLGLFARQARSIVESLAGSKQGVVPAQGPGDLLHTLCGSALAVGSWAVAAEAQALEREMRMPEAKPALDGEKLAHLGSTVDRACAAIDDLIVDAS